MMDSVVDILRARGLLEAVTQPELGRILRAPAVVYAGFDPTAPSLQAGNLVAVMILAHFQRCGHRVVALVGGATALIGDPSGKDQERPLLAPEDVQRNAAGIQENLSRYLDFTHPTAPARLLNNHEWLGRVGYLDFLRDVGKHFRMGAMLGRESVRARLHSDAGMSYTEFSYQLLQGYDFLHLYDQVGCTVQVGGSDQWGNITAGIELIRRLRGAEAYGLTAPLVCDSAGQKFGKSAGNAIYLDAARTSPYAFYQFFLQTADADVGRFLKIFTLLPLADVADLEQAVRTRPEQREAQRVLAEELTRATHGPAGLEAAQRATAVLFGESMDGLDPALLLDVFRDVPATALPRAEVTGAVLTGLAERVGLCASRGAARRLMESGGFYVNNRRIADAGTAVTDADILGGRLLVLRTGRKHFHLVRVDA